MTYQLRILTVVIEDQNLVLRTNIRQLTTIDNSAPDILISSSGLYGHYHDVNKHTLLNNLKQNKS